MICRLSSGESLTSKFYTITQEPNLIIFKSHLNIKTSNVSRDFYQDFENHFKHNEEFFYRR